MKLSTNDCKQYIVEWYKNNPDALPIYSFCLSEGGCLSDGKSIKDWKRLAIAKKDNKVYRLFQPGSSRVDCSVHILIVENAGVIEQMVVGEEKDFTQYFKVINSWF